MGGKVGKWWIHAQQPCTNKTHVKSILFLLFPGLFVSLFMSRPDVHLLRSLCLVLESLMFGSSDSVARGMLVFQFGSSSCPGWFSLSASFRGR
jgi:hypothetical protein